MIQGEILREQTNETPKEHDSSDVARIIQVSTSQRVSTHKTFDQLDALLSLLANFRFCPNSVYEAVSNIAKKKRYNP
jgi:hypothetical protein